MSPPAEPRVLFQLTGSIACYKACELISRLVQRGVEVQTVASAAALRFVGASTLEGLSGRPVFTDVHEAGRMMDHVRLARWADAALLCPASADALNRLAAGLAGDAIGTLFLAWEIGARPYLIAPAMNSSMWSHPATRASCERLAGYGARILPVAAGRLACGESGEGRLSGIDDIEAALLAALGRAP
ncbi:MAG: flavoprotein [Gammaproteobacteria bacterium]